MKNIKQLLFAAAFAVCFSVTAVSAQKQEDGKKPPPKNPPVVVVEPKKDKPKEDKPKDDKKRPQSMIFYFKFD